MNHPRQSFSDAAQLAALRVAREAIDRHQGVNAGEREYHKRVIDCVMDRIEDAMRRKAKKCSERPS